MQQSSLGVQREITPHTTFEVNYVGSTRNESAHAAKHRAGLAVRPSNPQSVDARKPFPNFVVYIDSNWSGRSTTTP